MSHVPQSIFPPPAVVEQNVLPMIGWEAPVLSVLGEEVRGSAGLSVEVKECRMSPSRHTVAADADGNVAFEYYTASSGLTMHRTQLGEEFILDELMIIYFVLMSLVRNPTS